MKPIKNKTENHSANAKFGMGDYYGTGVKQKIGTVRRDYLNNPVSPKKSTGKAPRNLA